MRRYLSNFGKSAQYMAADIVNQCQGNKYKLQYDLLRVLSDEPVKRFNYHTVGRQFVQQMMTQGLIKIEKNALVRVRVDNKLVC